MALFVDPVAFVAMYSVTRSFDFILFVREIDKEAVPYYKINDAA